MPNTITDRLDACVKSLPIAFPGPGGAVAVLRAGEVLVRHAWGFAGDLQWTAMSMGADPVVPLKMAV
ncbi:hypothetical protein [Acidiphilium sp.]|uniref:hypothetical protein n=1 Tax=Acidiphilium sp. TaxID=527 RepID=UPI003D03FC1A